MVVNFFVVFSGETGSHAHFFALALWEELKIISEILKMN